MEGILGWSSVLCRENVASIDTSQYSFIDYFASGEIKTVGNKIIIYNKDSSKQKQVFYGEVYHYDRTGTLVKIQDYYMGRRINKSVMGLKHGLRVEYLSSIVRFDYYFIGILFRRKWIMVNYK